MIKEFFQDIGYSRFFENYWGKKHSIFTSSLNIIDEFGINDFFEIIERCNICFPQLTCLNFEGQVAHSEYLDITPNGISSKIDPIKVRALSRKGNTVRIKRINEFSACLDKLKNNFSDGFLTNISLNGYYSENGANGINPHYDVRHIFILQIAGEKEWILGEKLPEIPRHDYMPNLVPKNFKALESITLRSSNVLYIPPGLWHSTKTESSSLHLTVGVTIPDWYDFMLSYLKYVMQKNPIVREQLTFSVNDKSIQFNRNYHNEHRAFIELLKNDIKKFPWEELVLEAVSKKP
jgi:ribosomal protein L16 Arg81 hydroxylase